jgi:hypothetical protein
LPILFVVGLAGPASATAVKATVVLKPVTCGGTFQGSILAEINRFVPTNSASVGRFGPVIQRADSVLLRCLNR